MAGSRQIESGALRQAFGAYLTGVTVVTTRDPNGIAIGMTANSFTSVSLDPPLVLVCIGSGSSSFATFADAPAFAVNILRAGQHETAGQFARRGVDRFAGTRHRSEATGSPILEDCLAWFDCKLHDRIVAGDHLVLIGQVSAFGSVGPEVLPLGFARGRYVEIRDARASPVNAEATVTAYLVENDGRLLLRPRQDGGWTLPTAHRPKLSAPATLDGASELTLRPDKTFIYSIYEDEADGNGFLVYRSALIEAAQPDPAQDGQLRWFDFASLPWDELKSASLRAVLKRYSRERLDGSFSIYVDAEGGGQVAAVQGSSRLWNMVLDT